MDADGVKAGEMSKAKMEMPDATAPPESMDEAIAGMDETTGPARERRRRQRRSKAGESTSTSTTSHSDARVNPLRFRGIWHPAPQPHKPSPKPPSTETAATSPTIVPKTPKKLPLSVPARKYTLYQEDGTLGNSPRQIIGGVYAHSGATTCGVCPAPASYVVTKEKEQTVSDEEERGSASRAVSREMAELAERIQRGLSLYDREKSRW